MCEKRVEIKLSKLLEEGNFDDSNIYYTSTRHPVLKSLFSNASKTGNCQGEPDRLYYVEGEEVDLLIIFECKYSSIRQAVTDLKHYSKCIKSRLTKTTYLYFVAITNDIYEIYDHNFKQQDFFLKIENFENIDSIEISDDLIETIDQKLRNIHDYMRDPVKISDEIKAFFIACILISLKNETFLTTVRGHKTKGYVYDLISQNLKDYGIDTSVFETLRTDENNKHFHYIIELVADVINDMGDSYDLLSKFYTEFVSYNNSDGKALGIVLTPDHITDLMISYLDIKEKDKFIDFCAGSGAFLTKATLFTEKLYACEYQNKLYGLLRCNQVLFNMKKADFRKGDCFNEFNRSEYREFDKSAINPPYGTKSQTEMDFLIHQMRLLKYGGLGAAIVPIAALGSTKNKSEKEEFLDHATPTKIIMLNKGVFHPSATVHASIILYKKIPYENTPVEFIDYTDDGLNVVLRNGRIGDVKPLSEAPKVIASSILASHDWSYYNYDKNIKPVCRREMYKRMVTETIEKLWKMMPEAEPINFENTQLKPFLVTDIFTVSRVKNHITKTYALANPGTTPFVSSGKSNNGIAAYTSFPANIEENCITVANKGSVGYSKFRDYSFCATNGVLILRLKPEYEHWLKDEKIMTMLCLTLETNKHKYNYGRSYGIAKIRKEYILLPVSPSGEIVFENLDEIMDFNI